MLVALFVSRPEVMRRFHLGYRNKQDKILFKSQQIIYLIFFLKSKGKITNIDNVIYNNLNIRNRK